MIFCETWLNVSHDDSHLIVPGYSRPIRCDRILKRGGGVCLYHKDSVFCKVVASGSPAPPWIESLCIYFPLFKLVLLVLYVPPSLSAHQLNAVITYIINSADEVLNQIGNSNLAILGDLNNLSTVDLEQSLGVTQVVNFPTRGTAILDKILIDQELCENFLSPVKCPNFGKADHFAIHLKPILRKFDSPKVVKVYDYRQSNINNFLKSLSFQRWQDLYFEGTSIDEKCDVFYSMVNDALEKIPYTYVEMSPYEKPWMTPKLKLLINSRYEAYRSKKFDIFRHLKTKVNEEIRMAKGAWLCRLKRTPQSIWKAVRGSPKSSQAINTFFNDNSPTINVADRINEAFAEAFSEPSLGNFKGTSSQQVSGDWNPVCNQNIITRLVTKLKLGKAAGNDGLTPRLLKAACDILVPPLTHIFCLSLSCCEVPVRWKKANVVPIPKRNCSSASDFRPISLLPLASKILEKIVLASVKDSLINLYGRNQFGFRPGSSTLLAHITMHEFITRQLDLTTVHGVILITFDMKKAFDSLSHECLLNTLSDGGLPRNFILWTKSFLQSRKQKVILNGVLSSNTVSVTSGVPQGSVLAPYLFACHMGSLKPKLPDTCMIKYADDVTLLCSFSSKDPVQTMIKTELQNMMTWCDSHGLCLNNDKTKVLVFKKPRIDSSYLDSIIPSPCSHLKILGVVFNDKLNWDSHVDAITKSASRRIHVLRQMKKIPSVTKKDLLLVYESYILSIIEYNAPLFTSLSTENNKRLERIRKRCHHIICGLHCNCDDFPTLITRRLTQTMKTFSLMQNPHHIIHSLLPHILPRSKHYFLEPIRTERRRLSFIPYCCIQRNNTLL